MKAVWVVKESGERERFSGEKVRRALKRISLSNKEADEVLKKLRPKLHEGITTKQLYRQMYRIVDELRPEVTHKYNLKRALFDIGPAGYVFEDFIARLLSLQGYRTEVRQILNGRCVTHETDVVAAKDGNAYMVECKFHNQMGTRCRIQTGLYVYARFLDLQEGAKKGLCRKFTAPWLVTNTKFSQDVISYAECKEIPLLGWRYPFKASLESLIDKNKCYPVTVLKMNRAVLGRLLSKGIVTVYDIPENAQKLSRMTGVSLSKAREIVQKAEYAR